MYRHSQGLFRLTYQTRLWKGVSLPQCRRFINTNDYTEGTHHVATNQLDELLSHLESTKVSDPRTVSTILS